MITTFQSLHARIAAMLWLLLGTLLVAAPSTHIGEEWFLPLEVSPGSFALINQASGQVRVAEVSIGNKVSFLSPLRSDLADISGVAAGFEAGGFDQILLSSKSSNRMTFVRADNGGLSQFYAKQPGPDAPALVRINNVSPAHVMFSSAYATGGEILELNRDPNISGGTFIDDTPAFSGFHSMQPLFIDPFGHRQAVCVWEIAGSIRFLTVYVDGASLDGLSSDSLPPASILASNVYGDDGRLMVVAYVRGNVGLSLVSIDTGALLWGALAPFPTDNAPFPVGSVTATDLPGTPRGILITSEDGSQAAHAEITNLGTKLSILKSFTPTAGHSIHGLLPVPGRGIILLEGPVGDAVNRFRFFAWDGADWALKDSGALPSLLPPAVDFATIFWYSGEPMVDLSATLLQLDIQPDWTNGTGSLPGPLTKETYVNSSTGLANPVPVSSSAPAGATWVITNQYLESVSVTSLSDNGALITPSLKVAPATGSYIDPLEIVATFDNGMLDVFYRKASPAGSAWIPYTNPFTIGYTSSWQFYAKDNVSGATGPITERTYTFSSADLLGFDSDGDGVPDFVEQSRNLNAAGGPDSDGDGRSDLEELLDGTNPKDDSDFTPAALRNPPFNGEGFFIIAEPTDISSGKAAPGERVDVSSMASAFLASANAEVLTNPPPLVGQVGAPLSITTPVSDREWAVLSSPLYFNLGAVIPHPRDGREVYRLLQIPNIPLPVIAPILTGSDLQADAAAWVTAAQSAYASYDPVSAISLISPLDTAIAVLGEAALYDALGTLDGGVKLALGVPSTAEDFTLFGNRDGESERLPCSQQMIAALLGDGLSFANLLSMLEAEAAAAPNLILLVDALYSHHLAHSLSAPADPVPPSYMPGLPMPLDVLRLLVRGGNLPYEVDSDPPGAPHWDYRPAAAQGLVDAAKGELAAILAQVPNAYRPTAVWTIVVGSPSINGQSYGFINTANMNQVALLNSDGSYLNLDQGLGMALGTQISITGYTDVGGPTAHDAIEVIALSVLSMPVPTDIDSDANLLDDDWEKFFFGDLGVVAPFDLHPISGYTYLQYMLSGADPRADSGDAPDEAPLNLAPPVVTLITLPNTNLGLEFPFPNLYFGNFDWGAQESGADLNFSDLATSPPVQVAPDLYQLDLGPNADDEALHFFRLTMGLKE